MLFSIPQSIDRAAAAFKIMPQLFQSINTGQLANAGAGLDGPGRCVPVIFCRVLIGIAFLKI